MRCTKLSALLASLCLAGMISTSVHAAAIPWSNPSGSAPAFTWAGGSNDTNLFGSPTVVGNSFLFFPANFKATSNNGTPASAADRLEVDIHAKPGFNLTAINVTELGDYGILGTGQVQAFGSLDTRDLDTAAQQSDVLHTTPAFPVAVGNGKWSGFETITYVGNTVKNIHLVLTNNLQAITAPATGSQSTIEKTDVGIRIDVFVPEPASMGLLALVAPLMLRRRGSSAC